MRDRDKIIILIILLILAIYLIKTDGNTREEPLENPLEEGVKTEEKIEKTYTKEDAEFWIEKLRNKDMLLMDREGIEEYNNKSLTKVEGLMDLKTHEATIERADLISLIESISTVPGEERYNKNGEVMDKEYFKGLLENLNLDGLEDLNYIQYGITIDRTNIRTFPTYEPSYNKRGEVEFDRFQETAVYPLEPLIIYSQSKDGDWYFARIYNYVGWIPRDKVVLGSKEDIINYTERESFLVVIDRQINILGKLYDMGVRIPLKEEKEDSYIILLPEANLNGVFQPVERKIPKSLGLNLGYLPYTRENIISQAFKFKDEPYGWGGLNNTRDCSAFIGDIYRSFGLKLPRNTQDQGPKSLGQEIEFNHLGTYEEKLEKLEKTPPLSVLYMPGHAMLYLGKDGDEHFIIHQFAGYYEEKNGELEYVNMMKTAVTPITIKTNGGKTYLESVYLAKEFVLD